MEICRGNTIFDILSENIWFVWSETSYDGDKWRRHHGDDERQKNKQTNKGIYSANQHLKLSFAI